ncbi:3-deoxy-D-manno-octulosonate 8-phosphate phosphatase (KDO 8-P phosphatase) [Leeuwenhoekiella aestuarii]|uniref:3-deoxy-D-manno-octulosonate 8-phosphate phosphatase (KDO 8-P phosphatase) n=1 Tax=Leeuwenhoekiella aestuarii TaxID=2249426 RepID=A0A4V1KPE5_9FLAO|nr:HAD-IIIA family hydrolase [Leeuwenhoekiella aestuarii]RXG15273.1 3-deoxy-D-manno-octulosonate 8-phosphate phosphatase (KDO 8-P phosphatase) [Leeuwenhoekiella aestuarii]RXG17619.1 3-deoxy-D-manno-octulosonate 8-phosphate phosphatase (KDO 8-P phosphatase) [Leeuwenhoekiella aestuarii]
MSDKSYKEYLRNITTFIFDVDGVMTDGSLIIDSEGGMLRTMNVKDGYAIKCALDKGYKICIISGGTNEGVRSRLAALGVTDIHLGAHAKMKQYTEYITANNIRPENVLYMGDDIPDYHVMQEVGLPCCPQDAVKEIKEVAKYVSHKKGGKGCVRDVIEQVLKVQDHWMDYFNAGPVQN